MAASNYRVNTSLATSPALAAQLLNAVENLNQSFAQLLLIRAAMIQERDASNNNAADWATMSGVFGFVDGSNSVSSTVAKAAFDEIDSMQNTCAASLQQMGARFKQ